ncbi:MAG: glycosyltransferase [Deltaproteobacteria bacterium]|nr:glycosyltransferase [Deltaproteobacteria bacterium]
MPLVSAIIPTHNRASVLERAIGSVFAQTFQDYELIVVDDGSTDSTQDLLAGYQGRLVALRQENRGAAAARNLGVRHAGGELVSFLDSDDEWLPEKLRRQIDLFRAGDDTFVCHTDEIWHRDGKNVSQKVKHAKQGGRFFERALELCLISPSSVIISRALLDRVGWFDESLPAAEDYDLWLRLTAFYPVHFVAEPLVIKHGGHEDQLSRVTPAIDRFRIKAILKLLDRDDLRSDYRQAAIRELARKCEIVASGCEKKGKIDEAEWYRGLAASHTKAHDGA